MPRTMTKRWVVVALAAIAACKPPSKQGAAPAGSGSAATIADATPVTAVTPDAAPIGDAPPPSAWELRSTPIEHACGAAPATGTYRASVDAGRTAGKAKRWADAVAAFERALAVQDGDAVALGELAWATLQVGDAARALELAERAIAAATAPNARAASHFNAARAAEALGDLARARTHYEKSLALRPNDAIRDRLAKLAPTPPRPLPRATPLSACQQLVSIDAVCSCLATSVASWGAAAGIAGGATCEPAEPRGTHARLVSVRETPADPDAAAGGTALVLVAKRGTTWSALQVVDAADAVELSETPNAVHGATVRAYEERPAAGRTTVWIESQNQYAETHAGELEVRGAAALTVCDIPTAPSEPAACHAPIPLAAWDHTVLRARGDGDDRCEVRSGVAYRATLTSAGVLTLVLASGVDDAARAGRYQR